MNYETKRKNLSKENLRVKELVDMIIEVYGKDISVGLHNKKDFYGSMNAETLKKCLENDSWGYLPVKTVEIDFLSNIIGSKATYIVITAGKATVFTLDELL